MCPYARFQSVMVDDQTYVVAYDQRPGEHRGSRKKGVTPQTLNLGDCIDCSLCVKVCPTGIDIRDGLQHECIGCSACIDACDSIMKEMDYAPGLVGYRNAQGSKGRLRKLLRPRLLGYFAALTLVVTLFVLELTSLQPFDLDISRERQQRYRLSADQQVENNYQLQVKNKSQKHAIFQFRVEGLPGVEVVGATQISVAAGEMLSQPLALRLPLQQINKPQQEVHFLLSRIGDQQNQVVAPTRFFAPLDPLL